MLEIGNGNLTPDQQYTHMSLWALLASPLLIGCDMTKMSPLALSILSNDEVLEVNQDPLGKQARRVSQVVFREVWAKDMEDGSKAVGLFNRDYYPIPSKSPGAISASPGHRSCATSGARRISEPSMGNSRPMCQERGRSREDQPGRRKVMEGGSGIGLRATPSHRAGAWPEFSGWCCSRRRRAN